MVDSLINNQMLDFKQQNARRIALVETCFGSAGQSLAAPGRVLVGEGTLTKVCRKCPKPRQFFLFNDLLVYGNIVTEKKRYNQQRVFPLEEVKQQNLEDDDQTKNGWLICTQGKSFIVYAADAGEKKEWMTHIEKCTQDLLKKTGKQAKGEHAAVWVVDNDATICMQCKKSQFGVINRKHHCRKCGKVVCGNCSSKKFLLPLQNPSQPLRVCDGCYEMLSNPATSDPESMEQNESPKGAHSDNVDFDGPSSSFHKVYAIDDDNDADNEDGEDDDDEQDLGEIENRPWEPNADAEPIEGYIQADEGLVSRISQLGPIPRTSYPNAL